MEPVTTSGIISPNSALDDAKILKAKASLVEGSVKKVWAVIRPPQMDIIVDDTGIPLLAFPRTELRESESDNQIWEGSYGGFIYNGEYDVTFDGSNNYNDELYKIEKWWSVNRNQGREITVLDNVDMVKALPVGEYQVYAVLAPENENILNTVSNWVWDFATFKVQ
ncbi:hypothetical protein MTBBW1_2420006 [Desulfamplus magnetovallimortis]|uniref:Uncharacterized protein n=1 Tax=Desulfamplus magnetovallimortis TaxID=1246637 RepID=A0A1W1HEJ6_9BACT|nr:hypothetical protein [Desulfamplus magnetovallimortis]SLM30802.1 hypothetical protein MTBBW1_2420006 [Desulfamplus magnetovallimortis]